MDKIIISALDGIKAGVWQALHRDNIENGNIIRQNLIQPEKQVEIPFLLNIHVEKELAGMYLCISAAAANNGYCCF